ncbi:hypothetical protein [Aquimarina rhabdastrellae]
MKVVWTPNAELSYAKELENINENWSINEVIEFMDLVDDFVKNLENGLIQGNISTKNNMRSFVISRQTTLYFDVHEDLKIIELLLFWNNKENPKKLKKFLKI